MTDRKRKPAPSALDKNALPLSPPTRKKDRKGTKGAPDLRIEEIEDKHIPKDRNIFDK